MRLIKDCFKKITVRRTMSRVFGVTFGILSLSLIISLIIGCLMSADGGKMLILSPIILIVYIIFIIFPYSLLYHLLTISLRFSVKYAFIYNSILGIIFIIHNILYYKINWLAINTGERQISYLESYVYRAGHGWYYKLFLLFLAMQVVISLGYFFYKRIRATHQIAGDET